MLLFLQLIVNIFIICILNKWLSEEQSNGLAEGVKIRNMLAHHYLDVKWNYIKKFLNTNWKYYQEFNDVLKEKLK